MLYYVHHVCIHGSVHAASGSAHRGYHRVRVVRGATVDANAAPVRQVSRP